MGSAIFCSRLIYDNYLMLVEEHVVVLYVINYKYLYHHIVVLDRYTNSNLVYRYVNPKTNLRNYFSK